eukprot:gene5145-5385_t
MSPVTPAATAPGAAPAGLLEADEDRYDGIIIRSDALPTDVTAFKAALDSSLQVWAASGKKGVWLKVPRHQSHLIPAAVEPGFVFHHAEQDYVMMTKWLPSTASTLPPNASHQVGVGAFVVNEQQQVLVVQEANGPLRGEGFWKMPTGIVHQGEDLIEAVEREVFEETGLRTRFHSLIAVRQAHGFLFGKSDMFFCCGLVPVSESAASTLELKPCGLQGKVFDGTALRPRKDLLLWGKDIEAVAADVANGTSVAHMAEADNGAPSGTTMSNRQ